MIFKMNFQLANMEEQNLKTLASSHVRDSASIAQ